MKNGLQKRNNLQLGVKFQILVLKFEYEIWKQKMKNINKTWIIHI